MWGKLYQNWENVGKNSCKSTKLSKTWNKMGKSMPTERIMAPNRDKMENCGVMQPIARNVKPTLWVRDENLSFGLLCRTKNVTVVWK